MEEKNKIIVFITVIIILFIWLFLYAKPGPNETKKMNANSSALSVSALRVPETFYDFGAISMKNGNVSKIFKVSNVSEQDINLEKLTTSCMCTTAYLIQPSGDKKGPFGMPGMGLVPKLNEIIRAGESRDVEIVYNPNAHGPAGVGMVDRFVYLESSNGEKIQFEIKANVMP